MAWKGGTRADKLTRIKLDTDAVKAARKVNKKGLKKKTSVFSLKSKGRKLKKKGFTDIKRTVRTVSSAYKKGGIKKAVGELGRRVGKNHKLILAAGLYGAYKLRKKAKENEVKAQAAANQRRMRNVRR